MKKNMTKMLGAALLSAIVALSSSCSNKRDYGTEYNYETDCQYSYINTFDSWKKIQSDGDGQYLYKNGFIYYYSSENKTMTPLCSNPNCLHDMETDSNRLIDCNAYAKSDSMTYIQYYDGYIYYVFSDIAEDADSLYRIKKDGSKKDKIFTTDDGISINHWLIHRGNFYYELQTYHGGNSIYNQYVLKAVELSSNMSDKKAKVIAENNDEHTVFGIYGLRAYKNYICYEMTAADEKDFKITDNYDWASGKIYTAWYIYDTETEENRKISVPEGYSNKTSVVNIVFLKDKMLFKLYDNDYNLDYEHKMPIYSINYDLTDEKIWLNNVEQGKLLQSYDDYVIISDGNLQHEIIITEDSTYADVLKDPDNPHTNVDIYSADASRVAWFVYPMVGYMGNFNGFGPDGVNVEFEENGSSWSVYELKFDDVINCRGDRAELDLVSTRPYGALNKEE